MRRSAVIFMFIFTLTLSGICTGCGGSPSSGSDSQGAAGSRTEEKNSAKTQTGGPSDTAGKTSGSGSPDAGGAASIPDTDESAVSDWGTADPDKKTAETGDAASAFSRVLVDSKDLYFAVKNARTDDALGYEWKVYVENRTEQNLMFSFEKVSVNGVMCDPYWAEVVNAGKKGNCTITWTKDSLQERQIGDVTRVDLTLNVYNDEDYTQAALMHDSFTVFPLGEERAVSLVREPAAGDRVLVDNENCTVLITGCDPGNSWGFALDLYLVNKTDRDLVFSVNNSSVNGIMCDPFWAEIVCAGKSACSTALWDKNALSENEIAQVAEISLPLLVYAQEDITNPLVDETFTFTP